MSKQVFWAVAFVALSLHMAPALACQCVTDGRPKTEAAQYLVQDATYIFFARVLGVRAFDNTDLENGVIGELETTRVLRGRVPDYTQVMTSGGENGANCGYSYGLFRALNERQDLVVIANGSKSTKAGPAFVVSACGSGQVDGMSADALSKIVSEKGTER